MDNQSKTNGVEQQSGAQNFKTFLASSAGRIVLTAVFAVAIYGLVFAVTAAGADVVALIICIICGYFGWQALSRIQPSMFLWMSIAGWVVYFFIKGVLAVLIGVFIAPFVIGKKLSDQVAKSLLG